MPTLGDIVLKGMRETEPGIKGTESETLGDWILGRKEARKEAEKRPWYSWLDPRTHLGTLGELIFGKKKAAPLVQPWEETGLKVRGYSQEDIDKAVGGQIRADARKIFSENPDIDHQAIADLLKKKGHSIEEIRKLGENMKGVK